MRTRSEKRLKFPRARWPENDNIKPKKRSQVPRSECVQNSPGRLDIQVLFEIRVISSPTGQNYRNILQYLELLLVSLQLPTGDRNIQQENERELLASYIKQCVPKCRAACFPPYSHYTLRFHPAVETVYETRPKYELTEAISNLGGFVGMWMGVSLIAVYNLLEETIIIAWKFIRRNPKNLIRCI
ncbi:hypothetical protein NPIL_238581 [Nephila pilipes]|uniref:Uncharacterized protein n=1 Tax=Nephila pilipes TaxID=299642 RepID=A0A8X6P008_NEPPI|nr:hypothetical protein NPIL_238581 [Nephila pilipes]